MNMYTTAVLYVLSASGVGSTSMAIFTSVRGLVSTQVDPDETGTYFIPSTPTGLTIVILTYNYKNKRLRNHAFVVAQFDPMHCK